MNPLPDDLHFLRPLWLMLVLLAPAVWWALARGQRDGGDWSRACDPHLLPHILERSGGRASYSPQLLGVSILVLAALAMAGPAWERLPESLQRQEAGLVLVLDLSPSVRATDLKPDRLVRARYKLADLFRLRPDGQTALVAYAGEAFTVAPMTDDSNTVANLIEALDPSLMPVPGKRADLALRHAEDLLRGAGMQRGDILLITDRAEPRDSAVAADLAARGIRVSVLGLGGPSAAPVPLAGGGFQMDEQGRPELARLDSPSLRDLAMRGGGSFAPISTDNSDLLSLGLDDVRSGVMRDAQGEAQHFRDAGFWLLPPIMLLALLAFRRGWLAMLVLLPLATPPAQAYEWRDLWQRRDQQAAEALRDGDAEKAQALALDPALRGAAAYRGQEWSEAAQAFAEQETATGHYNRGNALAKAGQFEEAMDAYTAALEREPGFEDAQANLEAVRQWLEQQPPQQSDQSDQSGESGQDEPPDSQESEQSGQSEPGTEGESAESEQEAGSEQPDQQDASETGNQSDSASEDANSSESPDKQGEPGEMDEPAEADNNDESGQALSEAIDQALAEQEEPQPPQAGEALDPAAQAEAERRQSVEQWLRRVPDDPGALLRRKFALEYQRRQREGIQ